MTFFSFFQMCDLGISFTFHFRKKNAGSSVIISQNGVFILNWKENKEAGAICFEIRIPSKKNNELLRKVLSKIYGTYFITEKNKNIFWFVNNSEYSPRNGATVTLWEKVDIYNSSWNTKLQNISLKMQRTINFSRKFVKW